MDQPDLVAQGLQAGTSFGAVFAAYSKAFSTRDGPGLASAFAAEAQVSLRDARKGTTHMISPADFFTASEDGRFASLSVVWAAPD